MSLPHKGGLQGGQKDKPYQMFKEVAHSQSLHLTNLQKGMWLRIFNFPQPNMYDGPKPCKLTPSWEQPFNRQAYLHCVQPTAKASTKTKK
jgi:hypothetical protein